MVILFAAAVSTSCGGRETSPTISPTIAPTLAPDLPQFTSLELDRAELPRYESLEMILGVDAEYSNPYDAREITLDGLFTSPNGTEMLVPGFWDGAEAWRLRFTPSQVDWKRVV